MSREVERLRRRFNGAGAHRRLLSVRLRPAPRLACLDFMQYCASCPQGRVRILSNNGAIAGRSQAAAPRAARKTAVNWADAAMAQTRPLRRRTEEGAVSSRARAARQGLWGAPRPHPQGAGASDRRLRASSGQSRIWRRQRLDSHSPPGRPSAAMFARGASGRFHHQSPEWLIMREVLAIATRRRCAACAWRPSTLSAATAAS